MRRQSDWRWHMADNYFIFKGRRSADFGLVVESYPAQPKPARKLERISIPGRNGSYTIDGGGYESVTVSYNCYFRGGPDQASRIASWLYGSGPGPSRLEDTYHPGVYRLASFAGQLEIENVHNRFGRLTLDFFSRPELWLSSGDEPIILTPDPSVRTYEACVYNPTAFPALPLIRLEGVGAASINIGRSYISITGLEDYLDVDAETQDCFRGTENKNSLVTVTSDIFPLLSPGDNKVLVAGVGAQTISKITIWPRWWTL